LAELVQTLANEGLLKVVFSNYSRHHFYSKTVFLASFKEERTGGFTWLNSQTLKELCCFSATESPSIVVMYSAEILEKERLAQLLSWRTIPYNSQFTINFHSILNYQAFDDMDSMYIMQRTFRQFQNYRQI
jgi:superfamily II RNA helicase